MNSIDIVVPLTPIGGRNFDGDSFRDGLFFGRGLLARFRGPFLRPAAAGGFGDSTAALGAQSPSTARSLAAVGGGSFGSADFAEGGESAIDGSSFVFELRDDFSYVSHSISLRVCDSFYIITNLPLTASMCRQPGAIRCEARP